MAAAAIPLALTAISALAPYAKPIAMFVEGLFGHGNGAAKMQMGAQIAQLAAGVLASQGKIPELPTAERIVALLQDTVDGLNSKGMLNGTATSAEKPAAPSLASGLTVPFTFSGKLTVGL